MCRKICLITYIGVLAIAIHLYGQHPVGTPEQFLQKAGVALDNDSLIRALDDNRKGVLANAAMVLATRGVNEATPEINLRMKASQDKILVLTLAQALNILGSSDGTKQLEAFCLGKEVDTAERMRAAYALVYTKNYNCLRAMPEFLLSSHPEDKQAALLYLLKVPGPQKGTPSTLGLALLGIAANDPDEHFRTLARTIIGQIGDPATKDALLRASPGNTK